jgi:hypothetical protein
MGTPKYAREWNEERKSRKLPVIPAKWEFTWGGRTCGRWYNPLCKDPAKTNSRMYRSKGVSWSEKGEILKEVDIYQNDKFYESKSEPGSSYIEMLHITYDYKLAAEGENPWECQIFDGPRRGMHSLEEAEKILKEWGLSRLNYEKVAKESKQGKGASETNTSAPQQKKTEGE